MAITAQGNFNGLQLTDIPVLNPGDWFGKAWLIEIGGSYSPLFLIVEAEKQRWNHPIRMADRSEMLHREHA